MQRAGLEILIPITTGINLFTSNGIGTCPKTFEFELSTIHKFDAAKKSDLVAETTLETNTDAITVQEQHLSM